MKPLLLTGWCGPTFAEIANHTLPLMGRYAQKHGYEFQCANLHSSLAPPSWMKVPAIISALSLGHPTVVWLDADVVILDSSRNILNDLPPHAWQGLVEHETECGLVPNCGVWVARPQMLDTLRSLLAGREQYLTHPWWEQAAMLDRLGYAQTLTNGWPHATRGEQTELFLNTAILPPVWNHHPADRRRVDEPAFFHVTQYADRAAVAKEMAARAS